MRQWLNRIYLFSGASSGLCIVLICVLILTRVIGRWMGIVIPSSDDFAGFLLAASCFFGLAYTFKHGGHIRVSLFITRLTAKKALFFDRMVLTCAALLTAYLAYELCYMVWETWDFEELSSGYIAIPLWIVQIPLAVGMLMLAISVLDVTFCSFVYGESIALSEEEKLSLESDKNPIIDSLDHIKKDKS
jgi:TRAP-type C4-dicarboxylate transport system permease small subunit